MAEEGGERAARASARMEYIKTSPDEYYPKSCESRQLAVFGDFRFDIFSPVFVFWGVENVRTKGPRGSTLCATLHDASVLPLLVLTHAQHAAHNARHVSGARSAPRSHRFR